MPVRKSPAKKAPAKKTVAKKTTTKGASSASAKKTTVPSNQAQYQALADGVASAIREGSLDGYLELLDDALTDRANSINSQTTAAAKKSASTAKKTTPPPSREKVKPITPKKGSVYKITTAFKALSGAKVEFVRFRTKDGVVDKNKAVVIMQTDKPGNPKGKRVIVPVSALS
jgi:hypothetical protein